MKNYKYKYIYVAGPMSGLPKKNFPAFMRATRLLRKKGYKVVNPAELENVKPLCRTWEECLRRDLVHVLKKCYGLATLPGWTKSRGANLEVYVAKQLDMVVKSIDYWVDRRSK